MPPSTRILVFAVFVSVAIASPEDVAFSGVEDWQVNEILTSAAGDPDVRYVELYNRPGGCLFASNRLSVYDANGVKTGSIPLVLTTTCYPAETYFTIATIQADALLGMSAEVLGVPALPRDAGQVCFRSTSTPYDCVRWGTIAQPVTDLLGSTDQTSATAPMDGQSLGRIATTHIVIDDWEVQPPTPDNANDGTPWTPPDAGPVDPPVDAGVSDGGTGTVDASPVPVDAPMTAPDARVFADARNMDFLDLDPSGGAACTCRIGRGPPGHTPATAAVLLLLTGLVAFGLAIHRGSGSDPAGGSRPGPRSMVGSAVGSAQEVAEEVVEHALSGR